ncbi:MAG: DUF1292 domain-containing protein, partial [Bacilli bacterium]
GVSTMIDIDNGAENIYIVDEDGIELKYEILFTFESEEFNKKYVIYFDGETNEDEVEVLFSSYDDNSLYAVTNSQEIDMIEEIFNTFIDENEEEDQDEGIDGSED